MLKLDDLFVEYGSAKFAELGVFLDLLRSLYFLQQTSHWQASGNSFYGDHLLYKRLYEKTLEHIDSVAERAIGMGNVDLVDTRHSLRNMPKFLDALELAVEVPFSPSEEQEEIAKPLKTAKRSFLAERSFILAGEKLMSDLEKKGLLTRGLEQLLGTILDDHESFCYLLKQRIG